MYAVLRHGARCPTARRTSEAKKFRATLLNKLGPPLAKDLLEHGSPPSGDCHPNSHGDLSHIGMNEQFCLAIRLKSKFPWLLGEPYSSDYYDFRSSRVSRSFKRYIHTILT